MTFFEFILPHILLALIFTPFLPLVKNKTQNISAKMRVSIHISMFFAVFGVMVLMGGTVFAQDAQNAFSGSIAQGLGFISASLAVAASALGAGIAVSKAAPAAIGAISENEDNFGKAMIFVALAEGVAIYGLLIAILIINKL